MTEHQANQALTAAVTLREEIARVLSPARAPRSRSIPRRSIWRAVLAFFRSN